MFTDMDKVIISTGNILNVNKKVGQRAEDEVIETKRSIKQFIHDSTKWNVFLTNCYA